jgi:hypothetical protein
MVYINGNKIELPLTVETVQKNILDGVTFTDREGYAWSSAFNAVIGKQYTLNIELAEGAKVRDIYIPISGYQNNYSPNIMGNTLPFTFTAESAEHEILLLGVTAADVLRAEIIDGTSVILKMPASAARFKGVAK